MYTKMQINLFHVHYHAIKTSFMYTIMQLKPLSVYTDHVAETSFMYTD